MSLQRQNATRSQRPVEVNLEFTLGGRQGQMGNTTKQQERHQRECQRFHYATTSPHDPHCIPSSFGKQILNNHEAPADLVAKLECCIVSMHMNSKFRQEISQSRRNCSHVHLMVIHFPGKIFQIQHVCRKSKNSCGVATAQKEHKRCADMPRV